MRTAETTNVYGGNTRAPQLELFGWVTTAPTNLETRGFCDFAPEQVDLREVDANVNLLEIIFSYATTTENYSSYRYFAGTNRYYFTATKIAVASLHLLRPPL